MIAEVLNQYIKQCSQIEENEFSSFQHMPTSPTSQQCLRHGLNRSFTIHESSLAANASTITNNGEHRHGIVMISTSSSSSSTQGPRSDSSRDSGVDYRDSGTSSPQPNENGIKLATLLNGNIFYSFLIFI